MSERVAFDSEAILAFYLGEDGAETVMSLLEKVQSGQIEGYINIINLAEIYYILHRADPKLAEEKERRIRLYGLKVIPIEDNALWREAAKIKDEHSLSLADAFAAATAKTLRGKLVVGSDQEYKGLDIQLIKIRG
ncbi:MAG: PIN domain-containing protein [Candidatus Methanomethyliales bacterium]|nr:PIN domain-containing protein [Candidatus Methanomethylicales archaeon]